MRDVSNTLAMRLVPVVSFGSSEYDIFGYLNIFKCTFVLYDYSIILKSLEINDNNFKKLCILSGTDYNINDERISFDKAYTLYNIYKYSNYDNYIFWLIDNNIINYKYNINDILKIFNLDNINMEKYIRIYNNKKNNKEQLELFLQDYGFIFI